MIVEKTSSLHNLREAIGLHAGKVRFISAEVLEKSMIHLEKASIPDSKHEEYKYCNIDGFLRKEFSDFDNEHLSISSAEIIQYKLKDAINLIFVNGDFREDLSDKLIVKGISFKRFTEFDQNNVSPLGAITTHLEDVFVSLSNLYSGKGLYLEVESENHIPMPVQIIFIASAKSKAWLSPRTYIKLLPKSSLILVERFVSFGETQSVSNYLSEREIGESASLITSTVQQENNKSASVNSLINVLHHNSIYENTTVTNGGALIRNNHHAILKGERAVANLYGFSLSSGSAIIDNHTLIDHHVPNCESNELYKGVVTNKATTVFNGKIFVRKDAQKTNAYQSSKNILLSDDGSVYAKPQLEIYANDVKCSHGTSTGKIDESALFYLKSRGIGEAEAKKLLLAAFADEVFDYIKIPELQEELKSMFQAAFNV